MTIFMVIVVAIALLGASSYQAGQPVAAGEKKVYPGADERTPSYSQYFSWINNTNEGSTEEQTMVNLDFLVWNGAGYLCHKCWGDRQGRQVRQNGFGCV